jgi:hypothetical protein
MRCARCHLDGADTSTKEGRGTLFWHKECLAQGEEELAHANEVAQRFGFPPSALTDKEPLVDQWERSWQDNPQFFPR